MAGSAGLEAKLTAGMAFLAEQLVARTAAFVSFGRSTAVEPIRVLTIAEGPLNLDGAVGVFW